jgi:signal transduction histidine kinase
MTETAASPRLMFTPDLHAFLEMIEEGVVLLDARRRPVYANPAARRFASRIAAPGPDLLDPARLLALLPPEALDLPASARWSGDARDPDGPLVMWARIYPWREEGEGSLMMLRDVSEIRARQDELKRRHAELQQTYARLAGTQEQLLQSEKMASIGQLAAGIAHEINNPIGYVHSNLTSLREYARGLLELIAAYDEALQSTDPAAARAAIDAQRQRIDYDFVSSDLPQLLSESREGIERVRKIVQDLKDFSHVGRDDAWRKADLHKGLESTLNIVWNDLKYKAKVVKEYGELPLVECLPSELNQVFMNLLLNAGQAIGDRGVITLRTGASADEAWVSIGDSGPGIPEDVLPKIFDPFFTTKPVGQGTGLGLSISYSIVAKHHGRIEVASPPGGGAVFTVVLPVRRRG